MPRQFHLGHFIKLRHVQKAISLLSLQIKQKSPLYNNLDFTIYRIQDIEQIEAQNYYEEYIKRDSMYYYDQLFYVETYYSVQRAYKTREYHFLSLHSVIVYYAIGFYIRELMDKRMAQELQRFNGLPIHVYYGGSINYEEPQNSAIFYYEDYKDFLVYKEKFTAPEEGKIAFAVSLDIKSFFYTIDHRNFLEIIDKTSTVTVKQALNFDEQTKSAIGYLLNYFQKSSSGLPVSSQNLISNYLSNIYLSVFDKYVMDRYITQSDCQYIRYVDDFYLIFKTPVNTEIKAVKQRIYDMENDFAAFLMSKLKLEISTNKSERYEIKDVETQNDFLRISGLNSSFEQEYELEDFNEDAILRLDISEKSVPEIFQQCISIIAELKNQTSELPQLNIPVKESAYLNNILILKSCLSYSRSSQAIEIMEVSGIFKDLDSIDYLLVKPKVMFHLMTVTQKGRQNLFEFIKSNLKTLTSLLPKITLVDKFLHQMTFLISEAKEEKKSLLEVEFTEYASGLMTILSDISSQVSSNIYLNLIIAAFSKSAIAASQPLYLPSFLNQDYNIPLGQQIKLRRLSEVNGSYSVGFNHLLNEFQNLFELVYFNSQQKTAKDIMMKMQKNNYSNEEIEFVSDFFDRRNQNSISHTNTYEIGLWNISPKEYEYYKEKLHPILNKVYQALNFQNS